MKTLWQADDVRCRHAAFRGLAVVFFVTVVQAGAAFEGIERIEPKGDIEGWVSALLDGRLMTWWTVDKPGSKSDKGSVQVALARFSTDGGKTWKDPRTLFEFPPSEGNARYTRDARGGVVIDKKGGLHIFPLYWRDWSWEKFKGNSSVCHVMSDDNGKTWSDVQTLPSEYKYSGTHVPLCLSSGRIIVPIWHAFDDKRDWGSFCAISDDRGKTWRTTGQMGPGLKDEQTGVELGDGRVWMLFRKYDGGRILETFSSDGGETWHDTRQSRFVAPASPPAALRLNDGRTIVVWNNSLKPKHVLNRLVLAAAISPDEGKTWHGYREIARTNGVAGHEGLVVYPFIAQTKDGTVIVTYQTQAFKEAFLIRLDPEWLMQTEFGEDFSGGLDNWTTFRTEGVTTVDHPTVKGRKAMSMRKPNPQTPSGASLNFPFGASGRISIRLRPEPGFGGARICLTDHFTWPSYAEAGRFGVQVQADGQIVEAVSDKISKTGAKLEHGKWYTLGFDWDCKNRTCVLTVDGKRVADLAQLTEAVGVCYLRLWLSAEKTDETGLLVESVEVSATP